MLQRALRPAAALLMVALLVVPIVASGHTHRDPEANRSCATCVTAHYSPLVVMPAIGAAEVIQTRLAPPLSSPGAPVPARRSPWAGRAPPSPAPVSEA